jgi:hypothetical protein
MSDDVWTTWAEHSKNPSLLTKHRSQRSSHLSFFAIIDRQLFRFFRLLWSAFFIYLRSGVAKANNRLKVHQWRKLHAKHSLSDKKQLLVTFDYFVYYCCFAKVLVKLFATNLCLRPYHVENTGSRPITEVKQRRACLVLRWVTAWEHHVL